MAYEYLNHSLVLTHYEFPAQFKCEDCYTLFDHVTDGAGRCFNCPKCKYARTAVCHFCGAVLI
jgi:Zn finger protein HypA/HybF involved in hydrogenase expression